MCVCLPALGRGRMPQMPVMSEVTRAAAFEYSASHPSLSVCVCLITLPTHQPLAPVTSNIAVIMRNDLCVCVFIYLHADSDLHVAEQRRCLHFT